MEIKNIGTINESIYYPTFHINPLNEYNTISLISHHIKKISYKDIVLIGMGISGAIMCSSIITQLYNMKCKNIAGIQIIRKLNDTTNHLYCATDAYDLLYKVASNPSQYHTIILDDLIASGETLNKLITILQNDYHLTYVDGVYTGSAYSERLFKDTEFYINESVKQFIKNFYTFKI